MIHQPEDTVVEDVAARRDTVSSLKKLEELTVRDETRMQTWLRRGNPV